MAPPKGAAASGERRLALRRGTRGRIMTSVKAVLAAVAALAAGVSGSSGAAAATFALKDVPRIVTLSDPRISPDGRQIAILLSRPDEKTDKPDQQIDLIDVASGVTSHQTRTRSRRTMMCSESPTTTSWCIGPRPALSCGLFRVPEALRGG